jgi:uncharacterized protein (TIGR02147 family)
MLTGETKLKNLLMIEYMNAKAKNPHFSMRAFAKKIGVPQSAVSEILSGKRHVTHKMATKIMSGLSVSPNRMQEILEDSGNERGFKSLDMAVYDVISDWYYFAILSLMETKGFHSSPIWIAQRLKLPLKTVHDALKKLLALDLIAIDPKTKKISLTNEQFEAVSPVATAALKKANKQNLELAFEKLENTRFDERDFTAITLCFDPERMEEAKKLIREFRRKFCKIMESREKKEVYKMCVQLFPLSEGAKK